ncbi:protein of unknown function [Oenococcus oeni]|uniref:Uncharacterized protein n=1 Tax=Oenococcus oeni TaxID=1247 RepID=A0AAQ2ZF31_OENOE|nr:hypothetical protein OENI_240012 [Oenococcus oeni]SYW10357.1 hypothetical protein OENI_230007 [Oenococcus oeni]SYW15699.1 hypothetical protein OENI_130010 [Oenococcus oeni]SYW20095.1 hypothetical protein OENI_370015 [Oenococcus oeni]VDB97003.1 protein of unknown function [Oenococcus oeni]
MVFAFSSIPKPYSADFFVFLNYFFSPVSCFYAWTFKSSVGT